MSPTVVGKVVSDDDGDEQKDEPRSKDVGGHWLNRNGRPRLRPPVSVQGAFLVSRLNGLLPEPGRCTLRSAPEANTPYAAKQTQLQACSTGMKRSIWYGLLMNLAEHRVSDDAGAATNFLHGCRQIGGVALADDDLIAWLERAEAFGLALAA